MSDDARWPPTRASCRASLHRLGERLERHWLATLGVSAAAIQAFWLWRLLGRLEPGTRPGLLDSIIFEYVGWYVARGGRLYVDVWEIKPPLAFELPAVLAVLAGGDLLAYHAGAVLVTAAAGVGAALLVGGLVHHATRDGIAAIAAGLALFAFPAFGWRAAVGFKAKYFVLLAGLAAVYLALTDRPRSSGIAGAASVGFWQLGVVFPALALGIAATRSGRTAASRVTLGGVLGATVILLPVVAWGAAEEMVVEVLLVPLVVGEGGTPAGRLWSPLGWLGLTLPIVLVGALGTVLAATDRHRWVLAGSAWFVAAVFLVDLDGLPDLFPLVAFAAIGVGLLSGARQLPGRPVAGLVVATVLVTTATAAGLGPSPLPSVEVHPAPEAETQPTPPYSAADQRTLFWNGLEPTSCRVFYGDTQHRLVTATGQSVVQDACGDVGPVWQALTERLPRP